MAKCVCIQSLATGNHCLVRSPPPPNPKIMCFVYLSVKKDENIYEEIQEVRQDCSSGSNTDSGIGVSKSFTSSGGSIPSTSKGTLDVKKKAQQQQSSHHHQHHSHHGKPLSSLDALLSQTTLTPDERLDLRKSLVDELFEELIQRHHKRVLEELKLDVEEFIAPENDLEGMKLKATLRFLWVPAGFIMLLFGSFMFLQVSSGFFQVPLDSSKIPHGP